MYRPLILIVLLSGASSPQSRPAGPAATTPAGAESSIERDLKITTQIPAEYPPKALKKGIHGQVVLHVFVSDSGIVQNFTVVSGAEELRQAALDAVRQWKFEPYLENGKPIPVGTTIPINFTLPETIELPSGAMKDYIVHRVDPQFPRVAVGGRVQGTAVLHAIIGKDGTIKDLAIVSGQSSIAHAAFDAVKTVAVQTL